MSDSRTTRAKAKQGAQPIVELKLVRAGAPGLDPREDEEQEQAQEDNVPVLGTDARSPSPPPSSPDTIQADDEEHPEEFFQNRPWIDPTVRSHPYPQMNNQALLEYYNQVLQVNPLVNDKVRFAFSRYSLIESAGTPEVINRFSDLELKTLRLRYKDCAHISAKCIEWFFGSIAPEMDNTIFYQYRCMERFFSRHFTDHERELILFIILIDYYRREVFNNREKDPETYAQWNESVSAIITTIVSEDEKVPTAQRDYDTGTRELGILHTQQAEWYPTTLHRSEVEPCWPFFVALWWAARDNRFFDNSPSVVSGRNVLQTPVPFCDIKKYWNQRLVRGESFLKMGMVYNIRFPGEQWRRAWVLPMNRVLYCYNPFEPKVDPYKPEIVDLYDLIKKEWQHSDYYLMILAMEAAILRHRLDEKILPPHMADINDIDQNTFWFLVRQPYLHDMLLHLSGESDMARRYKYLKTTALFERGPLAGELERRPSSFSKRKDVKALPILDTEPLVPGEKSSSSDPSPVPPAPIIPETARVTNPFGDRSSSSSSTSFSSSGRIGSLLNPTTSSARYYGTLPPDDPRRKPLVPPPPSSAASMPSYSAILDITIPPSLTEAEKITWLQNKLAEMQNTTQALLTSQPVAAGSVSSAASGNLNVMVATKEEMLKGPDYGHTWTGYPYQEAFRSFKANIEANHKHLNGFVVSKEPH